MDCVIPRHSVRPFCAAIGTLSRIGKELYVDFDATQGLTLRSLNDAKSAFCSFHFAPSFFERCTAPPSPSSSNQRKRPFGMTQEDDVYSCRVSLKALTAVVKPRRGVMSLRVRNETSNEHAYLSFEFRMELNKSPQQRRQDTSASTFIVVHRIGIAAYTDGVDAIAPKDDCSELVVPPKMLQKMLEPLKGTAQVALIVNDVHKVVTATSFHHGDATESCYSDNAVLQVTTSKLLKTETSVDCDEFYEYDFRDDRSIETKPQASGIPPPPSVNESVTLVFGIKEIKAMLQFCAQAHLEQELRVTFSFQWGGQPVIVDTEGDSFSAQLIMATLDHKLLGGIASSHERQGVSRNDTAAADVAPTSRG